jgi:predicted RNA-binding protein YlxR (DUF448 family)
MAPKPELVRLGSVSAGHENRATAQIDHAGTLPGRGAYVCRERRDAEPKRDCMRLATKRGVLQRAFRRAVDVPVELVGP